MPGKYLHSGSSTQNDTAPADLNHPSFQELAEQWRTTWEGHWQSIKGRDFPEPLVSHAAGATTLADATDYGPNARRLIGSTADVIISYFKRNWTFVEEILPKGNNTPNDFWEKIEALLGP